MQLMLNQHGRKVWIIQVIKILILITNHIIKHK
jgi:hypothetical protein